MSVLIVTSLGDIVVDLFTDRCPLTCKNFLKLCKIKYYNGCLFHTVQKDFTAQTGDPTGIGSGGDSVYKFLYGDQARFFTDEIHLDLKHGKMGTIAMASAGENFNASQFYFTLRDDLDYLDGKHTVFGEAAEGLETLGRINEAYVDDKGRPYKNIRIKHTYILDDPFDDPCQLAELIPEASPEGKPKEEVNDDVRLEDDWVPMDEQVDPTELEEIIRTKDAHSRAVVLESIGDIPDAEIKPPDNVLFVCKLNPVTEDEDLHTIFSRFGVVVSAEVIRDFKTGDSLCYAFIEFETNEACEQAYFKMDNTLIDDRRIHVDFSQSVARLWSQYRRGHKGKGCFKCGALDHVAKDCTGGEQAITKQHSKYVLKDDNTQRGGGNSRYEMVFDGNNPGSPEHKKRHRDREREGRADKQRARRPSSEDTGHREDERLIPRKRSPPRVDEFFEGKIGREKQMERERRHSRYEREDRERNLGSGDHRRKADGFADRDTSDKKKSVVTYRRKSEYSDDHNREGGRDYGRQQTEEVQNRHRKNRDKSYDHEHRSRRR